ncbi:MAG TPA: hypothetical protein VLC74_12345 [Rhizomicrobium sp.]|nr:hypothetical protein [Rhizomicrobium sp.]
MNRVFGPGLISFALAYLAGAAWADDQPFITVYTTDIDSQYEKEIEQSLNWSTQKPHQAFNGLLSRTELEYGVTDDFQVSGYFNYEWERSRPHPDIGPDETWHATSVSGEAVYRFLNPYFDPVGLAVYFEPTYGDNTRELEAKLLLQKNFFNSSLRIAANINFEDMWERENGRWNKGSAAEFFAGAAYNVSPEWSVGIEFNNENDFEGLFGNAHAGTTAYYLGPTISYAGLPFVVRLGTEFQLPWAGAHVRKPGVMSEGYLADDERLRVGFRISMDLP